MASLQVLIPVPEIPTVLAGLPAALRTAHKMHEVPGLDRIVLCAASSRFQERWARTLKKIPKATVERVNGACALPPSLHHDAPLLILSPAGLPGQAGLKDFLEKSASNPSPSFWTLDNEVVAAYYPRAERLLHPGHSWKSLAAGTFPQEDRALTRIPAAASDWQPLRAPEHVREAERRLLDSLHADADGYIARYDRGISIALSRLLVRTPVSPNQITTLGLALGLLGAWLLIDTSYARQILGAMLLWFCCILDGCDGEVAKLKLQTSPQGETYDVVADHVAHLATFAAILIHIRRMHPETIWDLPAAILASGVLACMVAVWRMLLRKPWAESGAAQKVFERIASRDYVYLVVILVIARHLHWFLWSAAIGSHVFWLSLWKISTRPSSDPVPQKTQAPA